MDFYIDIGVAVLLRVLKDRRNLAKYRAMFIKVASAIVAAYEADQTFMGEVTKKAEARK